MRRVSYPVLFIIIIIVGVAVASLSFKEFSLSVGDVHMDRGSDAILGLQLGLDLQGGSDLVYEAQRTAPTSLQIQQAISTIQQELASDGVVEATVQKLGDRDILVRLPEAAVVAEVTEVIEEKAQVEFREKLQLGKGSHLVYEVLGSNLTPAQLQGVIDNFQQQLQAQGVEDAIVRSLGGKSILVQLPGVGDTEEASGLIRQITGVGFQGTLEPGGAGTLYFQVQGDNPTPDQIEGVMSIIRRRVDAFGVTEPVIQKLGERRILVQLPGITDVEKAQELIGRTALLEFRNRECLAEPCNVVGNYIDTETGLTGDDLVRSFPGQHPTTGVPVVNFEFKSGAARDFAELTTRLAQTGGRIAIFLDDEELVAPVVQQSILRGAGFIEGSTLNPFTPDEVRNLAIQLESGILPVPIEVVRQRNVNAILGQESLEKSLIAGLIGLGLVLVFMVVYYRALGLVASVALLLYAVIILGVFKLVPVTLTLSGIAAFILSMGLAVDANVLIFERIKEELRGGRSLFSAIQIGFNRAWPAIRDSNVSTFITCAILYWFGQRLGTSVVQGFALTLFIGVSISMFTAITVTRTFMVMVANTPLGRGLSLFSPERVVRPGGEPGIQQALEEAD